MESQEKHHHSAAFFVFSLAKARAAVFEQEIN
jgi:hypothetical protein